MGNEHTHGRANAVSKIDDLIFWERIAEMPLWEAEQECVMRREENALQRAMLQNEKDSATAKNRKSEEREIGAEIYQLMSQSTKLNERITMLRKLQDKIHWRSAVKALYGDEAVTDCLVWMETNNSEIWEKRREWSRK